MSGRNGIQNLSLIHILRARQETIAHNLYAVLREFDDLNADVIYSESFEGGELSQAIMNRLCKAAGYHMMNV